VKCRGREYLRIIYGPEYTMPQHLTRLRERGAVGVEGLERLFNGSRSGAFTSACLECSRSKASPSILVYKDASRRLTARRPQSPGRFRGLAEKRVIK
jgi:hypothetical protein